MSKNYYLSPTAIGHLRHHKKWSLDNFGKATTKKYFQALEKEFQYIANNYKAFPKRTELTGENSLLIYPAMEHYVVFIPMDKGMYVVGVFRQSQDIPNIIKDNSAAFQREIDQFGFS